MNYFLLHLVRFQVYTAKSLYVEKSSETFDDSQLQRLSDATNDIVEAEIKINLLPTSTTPRLSSFFNLNKLNLLPMRNMVESSEDDLNNEIEKSDVIEIEVPVIGIDYVKVRKEQMFKNENTLEINEDVDTNNGHAEAEFYTTESPSNLYTTDDILTFGDDFQTSPSGETTNHNIVETTTPSEAQVGDANTTTVGDETSIESADENHTDRIQTVESKLIEQWQAADSTMSDGSFKSKLVTVKSWHYPKYPFNVKIVVNNDDEKKSCKSKASCSQVRASRSRQHDIDPEFYVDYSDEDLNFESEPLRYFDKPNVLRSRNARRAADDIFTPAPRFQPFQPLQPLIGLKKPSFIERLENESSLERSERVNKNLDGLMRIVGVWAHVDKFVSDRARTAIQQLAYLTGDDYGDFNVGSKKGSDRKRTVDDPFT